MKQLVTVKIIKKYLLEPFKFIFSPYHNYWVVGKKKIIQES